MGYKLAVLPVAGALLGGVLGGPLGLLAGFKAAGVAAALGGGALGFAGGNLVQKHRRARVDLQMKQLTAPPSEASAEPELSKDKWPNISGPSSLASGAVWSLTEAPGVWTQYKVDLQRCSDGLTETQHEA